MAYKLFFMVLPLCAAVGVFGSGSITVSNQKIVDSPTPMIRFEQITEDEFNWLRPSDLEGDTAKPNNSTKYRVIPNFGLSGRIIRASSYFMDTLFIENIDTRKFHLIQIDNYRHPGISKANFFFFERIIAWASSVPWLVLLTKEGRFSIIKLNLDLIDQARFDYDVKLPENIPVAGLNENNCKLLYDSEKNDFVFYYVSKNVAHQARLNNSRSRSAIIKWIVGLLFIGLVTLIAKYFRNSNLF